LLIDFWPKGVGKRKFRVGKKRHGQAQTEIDSENWEIHSLVSGKTFKFFGGLLKSIRGWLGESKSSFFRRNFCHLT
jgi:hypothetical protein